MGGAYHNTSQSKRLRPEAKLGIEFNHRIYVYIEEAFNFL